MNWIFLCVICTNIAALQAKHELNIKKLIEIIRRRNSLQDSGLILGAPRYPNHLPEAEPMMPGHTLIRPAKGMLKSAVKFPLRDMGGSMVYGNLDNIGLSYGKNERVLYSGFRKSSNVLAALARAIQKSKKRHQSLPLIYYAEPVNKKHKKLSVFDNVVTRTDEENDAREIIDTLDPKRNFFEQNVAGIDFRRKKSRSNYRQRSNEGDMSIDSDATSGSSEYERNPGNPYTIHKNKYKRNWLWNHFMDGDHMNINPNGPKFQNEGPSGSDLFFGRKWWYFNQDDYKPMK